MLKRCCRQRDGEESSTPRLNSRNYANFLGYVINVGFTYLGGTLEVFGGDDVGTVSDRYQTIITPAGTAFSIWGVIFLFQAVFAVAQMLPKYRGHPLVQSGVSYWYLSACLFQSVWTVVWANEIIWASLVIIIGIWISLVGLVVSQYVVTTSLLEQGVDDEEHVPTAATVTKDDSGTVRSCCDASMRRGLCQFWILKFPFEIHCGWITCATTLNFNVMFIAAGFTAPRQLTSAIVSLAVLHAVALFVLYVPRRPNYTVPLVITWANAWIASELSNPKGSITERFSEEVITAVRYSASAVAVIILILVTVRLIIAAVSMYFLKSRQDVQSTSTLEAETGQEVTSAV